MDKSISCDDVFQTVIAKKDLKGKKTQWEEIQASIPKLTFVEQNVQLTKQVVYTAENRQIVLVRGASKTGKTVLTAHALRYVTCTKAWVNCSRVSDISDLRAAIRTELRAEGIHLDDDKEFWDTLANALRAGKICLVLDDFHQLSSQSLRIEAWQFIKALNDTGMSIVVIGVESPQMRDIDESDLLGRVLSIDISAWAHEDLARIGNLGFNRLGITALNLDRIVQESLTSPFLMQLLCLLYCKQKAQIAVQRHHIERIDDEVIARILPEAGSRIHYLETYTTLTRTHDSAVYTRHDGKTGTLNQLILYAMSGQYPLGSLPYFELHLSRLLGRVVEVVSAGERERFSYDQIVGHAQQMAENYHRKYEHDLVTGRTRKDPVIDLVGFRLHIRDPFLLFYLRNSTDVEQQFG